MAYRSLVLRGAAIALLLTGCTTLRTGDEPSRDPTIVGQPEAATASTPSDSLLEQQRTGVRKSVAAPTLSSRSMRFDLLRARDSARLKIHFLPIGTGSCQLVECPGAGAIPLLIDCGSTGGSSYDVSETRAYIQDIVREGTINVVVSHSDDDHANLIPDVLDPEQINSLWIGDKLKNYKAPFRQWTNRVKRAAAETGAFFSGNLAKNWINDGEAVSSLQCGTANTFILGVNNGSDANSNSLMLAVEFGAFIATFTGDATRKSELAAIDNYPDALETTLLSASHHGAETEGSNSSEWAEATRPSYLIYTAGDHARFRHPRCNAVAIYREAGELSRVPAHQLRCGTDRSWSTRTSSLAEYSTYSSGLIIVSAGRTEGDVSVSCSEGNCE